MIRSNPPSRRQGEEKRYPHPDQVRFQASLNIQPEALSPLPIKKIDTKAEDASIWRDTGLRYGGYADEVGEFVSPYLGGIGRFVGYGISTAYCLADMFGSTLPQKYRYTGENGLPQEHRIRKTLSEALDLGLFHAVATLWIPPMLIGSVVEASDRLLDRARAHAPEAGGDPLRGALERGMDRLIRPFQQPMADKVDHWLDNTGVSLVSGKPLKLANHMLEHHRGHLEAAARLFARLASGCERIPGLKNLIGADDLHRNATDIGRKQTFQPKELAKLLFIKPVPVAIGIGMVPLIAHPFDRLMQTVLDWTVRPVTGKNKLEKGFDGKLRSVRNPAFWHTPVSTHSQPMTGQSPMPPLNAPSPSQSAAMPYRTPVAANPMRPTSPFQATPTYGTRPYSSPDNFRAPHHFSYAVLLK